MLPLQWCLPYYCQPCIQDADKDIRQRELSLKLSWRYPGASHACKRSFFGDRVLGMDDRGNFRRRQQCWLCCRHQTVDVLCAWREAAESKELSKYI